MSEVEAKELVRSHRKAKEEQIAAYSYRNGGEAKKNPAGWIIAAIKNQYEVPSAYLERDLYLNHGCLIVGVLRYLGDVKFIIGLQLCGHILHANQILIFRQLVALDLKPPYHLRCQRLT